METTPKRAFKGTVTEMLLAISTIMNSAQQYQKELIAEHDNWQPPFFENIMALIKHVLQTYVGVDSAANLRKATKDMLAIQKLDFRLLGDVRTSITSGFLKNKSRREEMLHLLGYTTYNNEARLHDQEALYTFLAQFAKAATPDIQQELIKEGVSPKKLAAILVAAQPFIDAETTQEGFKGIRPSVTAEAVLAYNDVYEQVMAVARNAARDFSDDKPKAKQFSYAHVLKLQGSNKGDDDNNGNTGTNPSN